MKDKIMLKLRNQTENSTFEEIFEELVFQRMIERGLQDTEQGSSISHEEMGKKINSWRK